MLEFPEGSKAVILKGMKIENNRVLGTQEQIYLRRLQLQKTSMAIEHFCRSSLVNREKHWRISN
jgi:hypothetical protein